MDKSERRIWQKEESYWNTLSSMDFDGYKELLHDDFSDWPADSRRPLVTPSEMIEFARSTLKSVKKFSYNLEPCKIKIIGDLAVVYFAADLVMTTNSNKVSKSSHRFTHTWKKGEKGWKLLSGMQN